MYENMPPNLAMLVLPVVNDPILREEHGQPADDQQALRIARLFYMRQGQGLGGALDWLTVNGVVSEDASAIDNLDSLLGSPVPHLPRLESVAMSLLAAFDTLVREQTDIARNSLHDDSVGALAEVREWAASHTIADLDRLYLNAKLLLGSRLSICFRSVCIIQSALDHGYEGFQ